MKNKNNSHNFLFNKEFKKKYYFLNFGFIFKKNKKVLQAALERAAIKAEPILIAS